MHNWGRADADARGLQVVGIILAVISGLLIGSSFVFKKKGLLRSQAGQVAGEGVAYLKSVRISLIFLASIWALAGFYLARHLGLDASVRVLGAGRRCAAVWGGNKHLYATALGATRSISLIACPPSPAMATYLGCSYS